jgi:hypothetical protein
VDGGRGQPVQNIECLTFMPDGYHVHAHVIDGEAIALPADVGIVPSSSTQQRCFYALHTHDASGIVHVEAAAPQTFTLGQLFAIWGQPLTTDNVAGVTGKPIVIYETSNATVTQNTGDWSAIELTSHKEVTIQIGTAIAEIPNFTWTGN